MQPKILTNNAPPSRRNLILVLPVMDHASVNRSPNDLAEFVGDLGRAADLFNPFADLTIRAQDRYSLCVNN